MGIGANYKQRRTYGFVTPSKISFAGKVVVGPCRGYAVVSSPHEHVCEPIQNHRMTRVSDEQLEGLYNEDQESLRRYVNSKLRDPAEAEDVVQESFLRLWRVRKTSKILNPRAFLFRTASNRIIDLQRKQQVRHRKAEELASEVELSSSDPTPEQHATSTEWIKEFYRVVEQLPPKCRRVFLMNKVQGISYSEIALRLGVSQGTVEKHMSRALIHCRKKLARYLD